MLKKRIIKIYSEYEKELNDLTERISEIESEVILAGDVSYLEKLIRRKEVVSEVTKILYRLIQE